MAEQMGINTTLSLIQESTYGISPGVNFNQMPFVTCGLSGERGLIAENILGAGRDPQAQLLDVENINGDIVVPIDMRNIGLWLAAAFGAPVTTGTGPGPYVHTFESGGLTLPSYSIEVGYPQTPAFYLNKGVMVDGLNLDFTRAGPASMTVNCVGQSETYSATTQAGTVVSQTWTRASQFQGALAKDNVALAGVTAATMAYKNNLELVETIRNDGLIENAVPGAAMAEGSVDVRFANTTLRAAAEAGTAVELTFSYPISASLGLVVTVHEARLSKPKVVVNGPGGISVSYNWQGAYNAAATCMVDAVLTNDLDGTLYA